MHTSSSKGFKHRLFLVGNQVQEVERSEHFTITKVPWQSVKADPMLSGAPPPTPSHASLRMLMSCKQKGGATPVSHVVEAVRQVMVEAAAQHPNMTVTVILSCPDPSGQQAKNDPGPSGPGPSACSPQGAGQSEGVAPAHTTDELGQVIDTIKALRGEFPAAFLVLWHPAATENGRVRIDAFDAGANMVTHSPKALGQALHLVGGQQGTGNITCDWCGMNNLTPLDYWTHQPLYHIYEPQRLNIGCQVCGDACVPNLAVHLHDMHGPGGPHPEVRTNAGSAVVVHRVRDNRFLLVQEFAGQGFWLPGGGNDPGEALLPSALRECFEEAGVEVEVKGLLEVKYDLGQSPPWRLAMMYAVPKDVDGCEAKTLPDFESAGACWVGADELNTLPLRNWLCMEWVPKCSAGDFTLLPLEVPEHAKEIFKGLNMI